jgi:hypothetical protein
VVWRCRKHKTSIYGRAHLGLSTMLDPKAPSCCITVRGRLQRVSGENLVNALFGSSGNHILSEHPIGTLVIVQPFTNHQRQPRCCSTDWCTPLCIAALYCCLLSAVQAAAQTPSCPAYATDCQSTPGYARSGRYASPSYGDACPLRPGQRPQGTSSICRPLALERSAYSSATSRCT